MSEHDLPKSHQASQEEGIEAIIYLQSIAGIVETKAQAEVDWASMSEEERCKTMRFYALVKEGRGGN
jgi:hypothetical protein